MAPEHLITGVPCLSTENAYYMGLSFAYFVITIEDQKPVAAGSKYFVQPDTRNCHAGILPVLKESEMILPASSGGPIYVKRSCGKNDGISLLRHFSRGILWVGDTWGCPAPGAGSSTQADHIPRVGMDPRTFRISVALADEHRQLLSKPTDILLTEHRGMFYSVPERANYVLGKCAKWLGYIRVQGNHAWVQEYALSRKVWDLSAQLRMASNAQSIGRFPGRIQDLVRAIPTDVHHLPVDHSHLVSLQIRAIFARSPASLPRWDAHDNGQAITTTLPRSVQNQAALIPVVPSPAFHQHSGSSQTPITRSPIQQSGHSTVHTGAAQNPPLAGPGATDATSNYPLLLCDWSDSFAILQLLDDILP
jgi:hypothetical protein